ncbi:L,D-transpeptidase family protein [Bacillus sp. AK128]
MGYAVKRSVEEIVDSKNKTGSWFTNWKVITSSICVMVAVICVSIYYYQINHFNTNITINGIKVGGLTVDKALSKLQTSVLKNEVYIGDQQILDGLDTEMRFTEDDLPGLDHLLETQWTFFPSFKKENYPLVPIQEDQYRSIILKYDLEQKLNALNHDLTAPYDSNAIIEHGNLVIHKSFDGTKYDVNRLLQDYESMGYASEVRLTPVYLQPIRENSELVQNQVEMLKELLQTTIEYQVQDQIFSIKASELIKNASITNENTISLDPFYLKKKITEINSSQSTLGKNFTFTTNSGSVITVKGEGYGWALDIDKETARIQEAFANGERSVSASNIHGNGWSNEGYGYETFSNGGIGDTYAEVSVKDQRMWLYKEGKMIFTTPVVTGKKSAGQDTSPGVWYILYKRTPYTLTGTSAENPYSINVSYWAPFTNSGQGFHDASWRSNWRSNAYLNAGSNGCVNVPPGVMKTVYENLSVHQPVVIY